MTLSSQEKRVTGKAGWKRFFLGEGESCKKLLVGVGSIARIDELIAYAGRT